MAICKGEDIQAARFPHDEHASSLLSGNFIQTYYTRNAAS